MSLFTILAFILHIAAQIFFICRVLLRPYRLPTSRLAWIVVIIVAPLVGIAAYILVGETNIGYKRIARLRKAGDTLPAPTKYVGVVDAAERHVPLYRTCQSINGYPPVGGNRATLMPDSETAITAMVADIDAATHHVHVLFYIWLPDTSGLRVVEALKRAAARGVICRAKADDIGSRTIIRSVHWKDMAAAGVRLSRAMSVGSPLLAPFRGRIDIRDHRKIVVIDNAITYCGSQNCADAAFEIKAKFAPWVDIMVRFEGPIVRQNQHLFASDWMSGIDEDLSELLREPLTDIQPGFTAQVIGTGVTVRPSAVPETFVSIIASARRELVITTPYYIPDEFIQSALCTSAYSGVDIKFIVPLRNDSWFVAAASRSYYAELLKAGVQIYEYVGGLLHSKTMTVDGEVSLIGSANIDRRSFELNFENNIVLYDPDFTAQIRKRQQHYIDASVLIQPSSVGAWSRRRRLWNNTLAIFGPLL